MSAPNAPVDPGQKSPTDATEGSEQWQAARLRRMRSVATALLALMAVVFLATFVLPASTFIGYLRAFAEASMVGALADWFAVTALFRHPLGLRIPHTAIVPTRKDQIGHALANFIREHFLSPEVLGPRLRNMDFARAAAGWLSQPENARRLGADVAILLDRVLAALDDSDLADLIRQNLNTGLRNTRIAPILGEVLDMLFRSDREQELMDAGIRLAHDYLHNNKALIHRRIVEETPWWLPNVVDREIYRRIVQELEAFLLRAQVDPDNPDRIRFNRGVRDLIGRLKEDAELNATAERIKSDLIDDPAVQAFLGNLWTQVRDYIRRETERPDSPLAQRLGESLIALGTSLESRKDTREELNQWLGDAMLHIVNHYRVDMAGVIADTIESWDPEETATRIELYVGRDLQFIRINGTLVGGLAGLAIHAALHAAGML
jgi:uncharacterized membrane-anchored protein YjiN (DUF445 family)